MIPPRTWCWWAKGRSWRNLKAQVERLGIAGCVTFAGYVPQDELGPYYRSADVFALASDFDNSPNVVLEAMACGLPVVATDVGGVAEYVAAGRGGELVPARDSAALARALGDWLSDAHRRKAAGAFNRQRVVQQFSWRASAQRLLEVYQSVIDERRSRLRVSGMKVALRDDDTCFFTAPETLAARLPRRLGSPAGLPRDRAVRDRLRTPGHSRSALALRRIVSARAECRARRVPARAARAASE